MYRTLLPLVAVSFIASLSSCGQQMVGNPVADGSNPSTDGNMVSFQGYDLADLPRLLKENEVIREHFKHNPQRLAQLMKESEALRNGLIPQQKTPVSGINCYLDHKLDDEGSTVWVETELSPCTVAFSSGSTYFTISGAGLSNWNFKPYNNALESGLHIPLNNFPRERPQIVCRGGSAEVTYAGTLYVANVPNFCVGI